MGNLGFQELLVIGVVALLVLGPRRLPEVARALGQAARAFRDALHGTSGGDDAEPRASQWPEDRDSG